MHINLVVQLRTSFDIEKYLGEIMILKTPAGVRSQGSTVNIDNIEEQGG